MISYPISLPGPAVSGLKLVRHTSVGVTQSPFVDVGGTQKQVYPNDYWKLHGSFAKLKRNNGGAAVEAALASLRGPAGCFYAGDPLCAAPLGAASAYLTNLLLYSEAFDNAVWTKNSITVTPNAGTDPNGNATADSLAFTSGLCSVVQVVPVTLTPGAVYVFSVDLAGSPPLPTGAVTISIEDTSGAVWASLTGFAVSGWTRKQIAVAAVGSAAQVRISINRGSSGSLLAWGAQFEQSTAATAYAGTGGVPRVMGASQTGRTLLTDGWLPGATVLRANDFVQLGAGVQATRIQASGGSTLDKFYFPATTLAVSVSGKPYLASVRLKNLGAAAVILSTPLGASAALAPGAEGLLSALVTGDGSTKVYPILHVASAGDAIDCVAWGAALQRFGVDENQIPAYGFGGWVANTGVTATLTQGIAQRLYAVLQDAVADSNGVAALDLWPGLRQSPFDNEPLVTSNAQGVFYVTGNDFERDGEPGALFSGLAFDAKEVL